MPKRRSIRDFPAQRGRAIRSRDILSAEDLEARGYSTLYTVENVTQDGALRLGERLVFNPYLNLLVDLTEPEKILPICGRDAQRVACLLFKDEIGFDSKVSGKLRRTISFLDLQEALRALGVYGAGLGTELRQTLKFISNSISAVSAIRSDVPGEIARVSIDLEAY